MSILLSKSLYILNMSWNIVDTPSRTEPVVQRDYNSKSHQFSCTRKGKTVDLRYSVSFSSVIASGLT